MPTLALFTGTAIVIAWGVSLIPRPAEPAFVAPVKETQVRVTPTTIDEDPTPLEAAPPPSEAELIREAALLADRKFMQQVADRKKKQREQVPGIEQVRQHWQQRAHEAQREIDQLAAAPEGTVQWVYREQLKESLQDGPR